MTILDDLRSHLGDDVLDAVDVLSAFIEQAAEKTAEEVGFGYALTVNAPNTFGSLSQAYASSLATGAPLPISSENSDDVIHTPVSVHGALRFWHDVNHVSRRLDFGLICELELSLWHLGEVEKAGHPRDSLGWRLLHADLTRHSYVQAFDWRFPFDQRRLVTGCVTSGFDHGLLAELRCGEPQ